MRDPKNIGDLLQLDIDLIGLIFYPPSPRYVADPKKIVSILKTRQESKLVGVFVNEKKENIMDLHGLLRFDFIQLHGQESVQTAKYFKKESIGVIKAFGINEKFDFSTLDEYEGTVDYFLFDYKSAEHGGAGRKFDWDILRKYEGSTPFLLSGGIRPEDKPMIQHPAYVGLDINSGFEIKPGMKNTIDIQDFIKKLEMSDKRIQPDKNGYYGDFGGAFIPEMLLPNVRELQEKYQEILNETAFKNEFQELLKDYTGRPTPLYEAKRLSKKYSAQIFLKREDLNHTGAHKINNTIGQVILAERLGKKRIIAETGAGQHGVATATVCALKNLECIIYMGALDVERQAPNVFKMKMLGAKVVPVHSGNKTLKDATNEAIRDWISHPEETHYIIGSVVGPHPYPDLVTQLQSVIGFEIETQFKDKTGKNSPDYILACVGGGSNAAGAFYPFIDRKGVNLIGIEAAGLGEDTEETAATLAIGKPGIIHGSLTMLMQDKDGQITEPYSISAGLDYPGIGPIHSWLHKIGSVKYLSVTDNEALEAVMELTRLEGIIPALESAHALAALGKIKFKPEDTVVINLSGRGDKDMNTYLKYISHE